MMELSHQVARTPIAGGLEPYRHSSATPRPTKSAPIVGAQISTIKGMRYGHGASGLGRIGGFGARTDARRWSELVLLVTVSAFADMDNLLNPRKLKFFSVYS